MIWQPIKYYLNDGAEHYEAEREMNDTDVEYLLSLMTDDAPQ